MDNARKKELVRGYKDEKRPQGIFAVRCGDAAWVGASRNLAAQQNQIWFGLRMGNHPNKAMQAAWKAQGEDAFRFEILEEVDDENALLVDGLLKDREKHWRATLNAPGAFG